VSNESQRTADGLLGRVAGKVKEVAGEITGSEELAREGRLQHASVEAKQEADRRAEVAEQRQAEADLRTRQHEAEQERQRLQREAEAERREEAIEADRRRAEQAVEARAEQAQAEVDAAQEAREASADALEHQAEAQRAAHLDEAARLEDEARRAEAAANVIDPEEN
jgi:uncharacterized protein YjbJ (UPF0337 family)